MSGSKEKIGMKRLISNVFYVLRYVGKYGKKPAFIYISGSVLRDALSAFIETFMLKMIIDELSGNVDIKRIVCILIVWFAVDAAHLAVLCFSEKYYFTRLVGISGKVQRELMEKARRIDLKCYDIPEYYDDFVIAASQADDMINRAVMSVARIVSSLSAMLVAGTFVMTMDPLLAVFPAAGFIINIVTRFRITKLEYQYNIEKKKIERKADYSKRVFYQPEYAKEIKLTGIEDALIEQYDEAINEERKMAMKYSLKILPPTLINWIGTYTLCQFYAVPVYLAYLALELGSIRLGDVASLKNATNLIKQRLDGMNYALVDFQNVGQYAEKFRRFMDYEINIEDCKGKEPIPENDCTLVLKNVSFRYKDNEDYVIRNLDLTIRKGEKIAIVGENGAGKTTLIKLIMRLYDVTEGSITFGGVDIRRLNTREYRKRLAAVFQGFQIYGATLAENVMTGNVSGDDRDVIANALKKADLAAKLQCLENGIDTELTREFSDDGTILSGGETQKVAVARVFARIAADGSRPDIAILDEPSSALDPIAEYRLNKSMMSDTDGQAVILISHRLSTTKDADRIILLENGRVTESGTHSELIGKNGKYAEMWRVQA